MIKSKTSGSSHYLLHGSGAARRGWSRHLQVSLLLVGAAVAPAVLTPKIRAQVSAGGGQFQVPSGMTPTRPSTPASPALPEKPAITANGHIVEDIVARVNDRIITRTEYERSLEQLEQQAQQEQWSQAQLADKERNMLRDMIDQQLLLSKGKELGITGDAETMRQLDDMRKKAGLDSMDALRAAAEQQGVSYEDFQQNIRNNIISQQVVQQEVGRRVDMSRAKEEAYYKDHLKEFEQPEQVHLSEILIPAPENATDAQLAEAQAKADDVSAKLKGGASFADLAKTVSGGPNASVGGDLGDFQRGKLGDILEKATFPLPVGGVTPPIRTRQGYVILKVDSHQQAGTPPLEQVENQVQQAVYLDGLQPALRAYLTKAREDAYMSPLPPGFVDTGAPHESTSEVYTAYAAPKIKKKVLKKQEAEKAAEAKAAQQLADAKAKLAAKQAADAAAKGGVKTVSATRAAAMTPVKANGKPKKVHREKVRFGQAPRSALQATAPTEVVDVPALTAPTENGNAPISGVAPGAAMTNQQSQTTVTAGIGAENEDPLAPQAPTPDHKTRFSARQNQTAEKKAEVKLTTTSIKGEKHAIAATPMEAADEGHQAQALGLNGDQLKKQPRKKRKKGDPVNRIQNQPVKPAEPAPISPTVNPNLGAGVKTSGSSAPAKPSSNQSVLPPTSTDTAAPNAGPEGQPIPSVTGTQPGAPASTVPQPH